MSYKKITISIVFLFILCTSFAQGGPVISPLHPKKGDVITGSFGGKTAMNIYEVLINSNIIPVPVQSAMGNPFQLKVGDSTAAFLIVAQNMNDAAAKPMASAIMIYGQDDKPFKGSFLSLSRLVTTKQDDLSLNATDSLAVGFMETEFKWYPEQKRPNLPAYLYAWSRYKKWAARPLVLQELKQLEKQKNLSDEELAMAAYLYELYGLRDKSEVFAAQLTAKEPDGAFQLARSRIDGYNEENYNKKLQFYSDLQTGKLPPYQLYHNLVNENLLKENFAAVHQLIAQRPKVVRSRTYYMVASLMIQKHQDLAQARKYAEWGYELALADYKNPKDDFDRMYAKFNRGRSAETMGYVLASEGKYKEAIPYFDDGLLYAPQTTASDLVDLYLLSMAHSPRYATVKNKVEEKLKTGQDSPALVEALRAIYRQEKNKDDGFAAYLNQLQAISNDSIIASVKKKMISAPAPDFTLNDINGNKVALASLKGKIVVVDFWATWCGPCIASFPGMQKAIEKYKNDPDVVFLFINTWERVPDPIVKVTDFIRTKKLPFTVLLDAGDKVVGAYGVKGIPNKFIIDRKGNIRFNSEGNPAGMDALVTEVSTMIEMAR
jgi:peroxiredoxin